MLLERSRNPHADKEENEMAERIAAMVSILAGGAEA